MEPVLYTTYKTKVVPELMKLFGYKNIMQAPRVEKVTLNVGYGRHAKENAYIEQIEKTLIAVTGQKPIHNKAKKSISNFKIRQGMPIGVSVTLRGNHMYHFLYKLIHLALPRVRDFRGLSKKSFDEQGNFSLGLKENISFPEVVADTADKIHPLQIVITTKTRTKSEGLALLAQLGFPFKD